MFDIINGTIWVKNIVARLAIGQEIQYNSPNENCYEHFKQVIDCINENKNPLIRYAI